MKTNKTLSPFKIPIAPLIILSLVVSLLLSNKHVFFGVHLPGIVALRLNNQLSGLFLVQALALFIWRRKPIAIIRNVIMIFAALMLLIVGITYAGLGVGPGEAYKDDGFTILGGFLMMFSGFIFGSIVQRKDR